MLSSLRLENVAYRFQPFVDELRPFLKQNEVAYGFPEHLLSFTEKLSSAPSLRAGVAGKVAQLIRSTGEPVSHGEIVELLLVTVGGSNIDEDTPAVQKAERVLSQLVGEVMTSHENVGVAVPSSPPPHAPFIEHAEVVESAPAWLDRLGTELAAEPQPAAEPDRTAREAVRWESPPRFVWAALLCGVLLAPCMYLLSRPHGAERNPAVSTSTLPTAGRPRPVRPPFMPPVYAPKPLDLDFGDLPAPRKKAHVRANAPERVVTSQPRSTEVVAVGKPGSHTLAANGVDKPQREPDTRGRVSESPHSALTPQDQ